MSDSVICRVAHRGKRESITTILTADNTSVRLAPDGSLVLELFRYGARGEPLESYQFHLCPEDRARVANIA